MAGQLIAQADTHTQTEQVVEDAVHETEGGSPTDGTHATTEAGEHGTGVFPPFDPSTFASQLLWLAITFAVLYLVLSRVALPRIGGILENRKGLVDTDLAAAETSRQKTEAAITSYEAALAAARANAHKLAEETRNNIKSELDVRRKAVEAELSAKVAAAEAQIQSAKTEALGHVGEIAGETAQSLVSTLFKPASAEEISAAVAQASKE